MRGRDCGNKKELKASDDVNCPANQDDLDACQIPIIL